jgi:hypothetical protein
MDVDGVPMDEHRAQKCCVCAMLFVKCRVDEEKSF